MNDFRHKDISEYRGNYAVYVLRVEMKSLGRDLRRNKDIWTDSQKEQVRFRMSQIKEVLGDLKMKLIQ